MKLLWEYLHRRKIKNSFHRGGYFDFSHVCTLHIKGMSKLSVYYCFQKKAVSRDFDSFIFSDVLTVFCCCSFTTAFARSLKQSVPPVDEIKGGFHNWDTSVSSENMEKYEIQTTNV